MSKGSRRGRASRGPGVTLVEVLVAFLVVSVLLVTLYGAVRFLFSRSSRSSLATMTERAFAQKDLRLALRKLMTRVGEGTRIVFPEPGTTGSELVFRDLLNRKVRLRLDPGAKALVSELSEGGGFARETEPARVGAASTGTVIVAHPIRIDNCRNATFTCVSPSCVVVTVTLVSGHVEASLMTAIHLRNYNLAFPGEEEA